MDIGRTKTGREEGGKDKVKVHNILMWKYIYEIYQYVELYIPIKFILTAH